ncbi:hypothetical protein [Pontibacillus yanchengensis]|uniref:Uncharacterized protein n=1 Tax=Pontibacillus yanchengensis Y32 TaxID=1385514 RepID=A0A0A2TJN8_9BACI|nr:hypothetical protein [Pontibacillus yanchengensis]KGP74658.1 hypothetical protein N782_00075 [Pontibacillus yanchengensis Y32]
MATKRKKETTQERVQNIKDLLSQGKTREEIAKKYKMKTWKSIDMFMRRQGYRWNPDEENYISKEEEHTQSLMEEEEDQEDQLLQSQFDERAEDIIMALQRTKDIRVVARQFKFKNHRDLGAYMRSNNYVWDVNKNNYKIRRTKESSFIETLIEQIPSFSNVRYQTAEHAANGMEKFYPLFEFLNENMDGLKQLLTNPQGVQTVQPEPTSTKPVQPHASEQEVPLRSSVYDLIQKMADETQMSTQTLLENAVKQYVTNHDQLTS